MLQPDWAVHLRLCAPGPTKLACVEGGHVEGPAKATAPPQVPLPECICFQTTELTPRCRHDGTAVACHLRPACPEPGAHSIRENGVPQIGGSLGGAGIGQGPVDVLEQLLVLDTVPAPSGCAAPGRCSRRSARTARPGPSTMTVVSSGVKASAKSAMADCRVSAVASSVLPALFCSWA